MRDVFKGMCCMMLFLFYQLNFDSIFQALIFCYGKSFKKSNSICRCFIDRRRLLSPVSVPNPNEKATGCNNMMLNYHFTIRLDIGAVSN